MKAYMNPPIPNGFVHVSGTWDKAFIIEDVKNKNQFTWIPLGICEEIEGDLKKIACNLEGYSTKYDFIKDMIRSYQGIYLSTYPISKNAQGKPVSQKGKYWNNITFRFAKAKAIDICKELRGYAVRTRLVHEIEYDSVVKCISRLSGNVDCLVSNEQFEEYGLYGMNDLWIWTLTNYSELSMILKKGDQTQDKEKVYANNESFESPAVGFRTVLILF